MFFWGKATQEELAGLLPMAQAYLAPHSGRALSEAALAGLPLIAYNWEAQAEVVISGETGELVPYRDYKAMAESFIKILNDKGYARKLGENARKYLLAISDPQKTLAIEKQKYCEISVI
jgi:glycosyltransferase involved in cell wall biosynthesis